MSYTCKDRFHLTRGESLFMAKKLWGESIFRGIKVENRNIIFPETKAILNGINVPRAGIDDVLRPAGTAMPGNSLWARWTSCWLWNT